MPRGGRPKVRSNDQPGFATDAPQLSPLAAASRDARAAHVRPPCSQVVLFRHKTLIRSRAIENYPLSIVNCQLSINSPPNPMKLLVLLLTTVLHALPTDSVFVEQLLQKYADTAEDAGTLVADIGREFLGRPYVGGTLEVNAPDEALVVNTREVDCTTFVDQVIPIANLI